MLVEYLIVREGGKLLSPGQSVTVSPGAAVQTPTPKRSSLASSSCALLSHRPGCTVSVGLGAEDSTWHRQHIPSPCTQGATAPWPCLGSWALCKWMVCVKYTCRPSTPLCWDTNPHISFLKQVTMYKNGMACCWNWRVRMLEMAGRKGGKELNSLLQPAFTSSAGAQRYSLEGKPSNFLPFKN